MRQVILCVGNRYVRPDGAALALFDRAVRGCWPESVRWVDGGLGGLSLLSWFEQADRLLLVDYGAHDRPGEIVPLNDLKLSVSRYDHDNALRYLLAQLPVLLDKVPKVDVLACPEDEAVQARLLEMIERWIGEAHEQAA